MKRLLPLLLIMISVATYADKYDDLVAKMQNQTPNIAFYNYQQFQKKNPHIGNVYYQLANISYDYLRQTNPICNLKDFRYHAYNSKLYYGNCLYFATESDVRKYAAYYKNVKFAEKPKLEELNAHIRPILKNIANITEAGNKLNAEYVRLSTQYERCVQIYLALNTKFDSFNDALLRANKEDINTMQELKTIADSIPHYITAYQQALDNYPIKGYTPNFQILPIELFRIDALCSTNFLVNNITLYDFSTWVKQFNTRRKTRVTPILTEAQQAYKKSISQNDFQASVALINALYQLDPDSYLAAVLQIRNGYNQVVTNRDKFDDAPNDDKRVAMLYDMSKTIKVTKEQHTKLQTIANNDIQKYTQFTAQYFPQEMPYEALKTTVEDTDSIYNLLLQEFRIQHLPAEQTDSNSITIKCGTEMKATLCYLPTRKTNQLLIETEERTILKTNVNTNARPKALFYLQEADQIIWAHDEINDSLLIWETKFTIYDIKNKQTIEWIAIPKVDNISYITTTNSGHTIIVNEENTQAVTQYAVDVFDQVTRIPITKTEANVVSVGHYNPEALVLYLMAKNQPQLLLINKK